MEFHLPELGEGVYEAELVSWLVQAGNTVKHGQGLMEVMTDKATMEVPSPFTGRITDLLAEPGQEIKVGQAVLRYEDRGQGSGARGQELENGGQETKGGQRMVGNAGREPLVLTPDPSPLTPVKAAPSVRQMARQLGVDLTRMRGSGPEGRILIEDVTHEIQHPAAAGTPIQPAGLEKPVHSTGKPAFPGRQDYGKPGTRIKLQGVRRKIAEHMVEALRAIPHYGYVDECEVTELVRLREELRDDFAKSGVKLTYMAFLIKAVVAGLKEVPIVNATLDEEAGEIILHDRYHIGIATATPAGLIVPIVRDADRKSLAQIAGEIERLSTEARAGKTKLEDLRGSTFTVTSIGAIGGLFSTPIINHPEVGILGIGHVVKRPRYDAAGNVHPADIVYLSFSFDHRVVDGAVGAVFGNAIIQQLQRPARLLLPEHPV